MTRKPKTPKVAKAPRAPRTPGWEHYFPIAKGQDFDVVLVRPPLPVRGRGAVLKRTATAIHLRLEVPGGFLIPSISAELELTYAGEGGGNSGHLDVQVGARRESFEDSDIAIHSHPPRRSREIAPSLAHRGRNAHASLHAASDSECRIAAQGFELKLVAKAIPPGR